MKFLRGDAAPDHQRDIQTITADMNVTQQQARRRANTMARVAENVDPKLMQRLDTLNTKLEKINEELTDFRTFLQHNHFTEEPELHPSQQDCLHAVQSSHREFAQSQKHFLAVLHAQQRDVTKAGSQQNNAEKDFQHTAVSLLGQRKQPFAALQTEGLEKAYPQEEAFLAGDLQIRHAGIHSDLHRLRQVRDYADQHLPQTREETVLLHRELHHSETDAARAAVVKSKIDKVGEVWIAANKAIRAGKKAIDAIDRANSTVSDLDLEALDKQRIKFYTQKLEKITAFDDKQIKLSNEIGMLRTELYNLQVSSVGLNVSERAFAAARTGLKCASDALYSAPEQNKMHKLQELLKEKVEQFKRHSQQYKVARSGMQAREKIERSRPKTEEERLRYNHEVLAAFNKRYRVSMEESVDDGGVRGWVVRCYAGDTKRHFSKIILFPETKQATFIQHFKFRPKQFFAAYVFQRRPKGDGTFDSEVKVKGTEAMHPSEVAFGVVEYFNARIQEDNFKADCAHKGIPVPKKFECERVNEFHVIEPQSQANIALFVRSGDSRWFEEGSRALYASAVRPTGRGLWYMGHHFNKRPFATELAIQKKRADGQYTTYYTVSTLFIDN